MWPDKIIFCGTVQFCNYLFVCYVSDLHRTGIYYKMKGSVCLSVCLCLFVCHVPLPNSIMEKHRKPKIGMMEVRHMMSNLFTGSKVKVTRPIIAVTDNGPYTRQSEFLRCKVKVKEYSIN